MEERLDRIRERLAQAPDGPGVYLMRDAQGDILYIGKAKSLRPRVRSYFQESDRTEHRAVVLLRRRAHDIEWIVTHTEVEALILEANLIRDHQPRYNIRSKDDKHFPYLVLTLQEDFPRLLVTRRLSSDGSRTFGPYTDARAMRRILRFLRHEFHIRDCNLRLPGQELDRPCLEYHLGHCEAPCVGLVNREHYRKGVDQAREVLEGRTRPLLRRWREEMAVHAKELRFEDAAVLRDRIQTLEQVCLVQGVDLGEEIDSDAVALAREGTLAVLAVLQVRSGSVGGRFHRQARCPLDEPREAVLGRLLADAYLHGPLPPPRLWLAEPCSELDLLSEALESRRGERIRIEMPQRGNPARILRLASSNAQMLLIESQARQESRRRLNLAVEELQQLLGLSRPPRRIEGIDISHLHGKGTVASLVCFVDGRPHKAGYRRFRLRDVHGIDDFASLRETVSRRFRRLREENQPRPDLVLIDGGKGQLGAALDALEQEGVADQQVLGLAKRLEEVFLPGQAESVMLPKDSGALRLLQQIRDEAHRIAISFQRSGRARVSLRSVLDGVPGIGPRRRQILLKTFGSLATLRRARPEEIVKVVGPVLAKRLFDTFGATDKSPVVDES